MSFIPIISGRKARKAFERQGWIFQRQTGSHIILSKEGIRSILSIPDHKTLKTPLLRKLIKDAGLTIEEFKQLIS
jgi:predicted RNA binding protein YcfA (HicA-like mRNA interferase family)